ncbi:MAG: DHH family phosphoesterase [Trueperaceae bacterium]
MTSPSDDRPDRTESTPTQPVPARAAPNQAEPDRTEPSRTEPTDNRGDSDYHGKIVRIAERLATWNGAVVVVAHQDPDGDALGSALALSRAVRALGGRTIVPIEDPPAYLRFLLRDDDLSPALATLPNDTLLVVLDVGEAARVAGAPLDGASYRINVDHHGTNDRFGDLVLVQPEAAATAQIVKDLIDALPVAWSADLATPCLTGLLSDTGLLRFGNTDGAVLSCAGDLIDAGVDYAELTDRLQSRPPGYFRMLGLVMNTVRFPLDGRVALAHRTLAMQEEVGKDAGDGDDFVGLIRYAEGSVVAVLLKEAEDGVKLSVRARAPISAQRICLDLGGGGHVAAAGAKLHGADLAAAETQVLEAVAREFARNALDPV